MDVLSLRDYEGRVMTRKHHPVRDHSTSKYSTVLSPRDVANSVMLAATSSDISRKPRRQDIRSVETHLVHSVLKVKTLFCSTIGDVTTSSDRQTESAFGEILRCLVK